MRALFLTLVLCLSASPLRAAGIGESRLWQEHYFWDGLLQSRDRAARISADPRLLEVINTLAYQAAQQGANLGQIRGYVSGQVDNLKYAFTQQDPRESLAVIQNNFKTLSKGAEQVRNNLYYLTTRVRMASTQALPDPKLTAGSKLVIAQVQQVQLQLNALYTDTAAINHQVHAEPWAVDDFFRYGADHLLSSVVEVQDSVFTVYNATFELYLLSKQ